MAQIYQTFLGIWKHCIFCEYSGNNLEILSEHYLGSEYCFVTRCFPHMSLSGMWLPLHSWVFHSAQFLSSPVLLCVESVDRLVVVLHPMIQTKQKQFHYEVCFASDYLSCHSVAQLSWNLNHIKCLSNSTLCLSLLWYPFGKIVQDNLVPYPHPTHILKSEDAVSTWCFQASLPKPMAVTSIYKMEQEQLDRTFLALKNIRIEWYLPQTSHLLFSTITFQSRKIAPASSHDLHLMLTHFVWSQQHQSKLGQCQFQCPAFWSNSFLAPYPQLRTNLQTKYENNWVLFATHTFGGQCLQGFALDRYPAQIIKYYIVV